MYNNGFMVLSIIFVLFQLAFVIFFLYMCIASIIGAPFVPTKNPVAEAMITLAGIKKGDTVYDMGSGNGKLLFLAASKGAIAIGYEINPMLVLYTTIVAWLRHENNVHAYAKNFWSADIHDAKVIFIYLLPWKMDKLAAKIKKECKKGTVVVSNSFIFPGWDVPRRDMAHHVYVFRV